MNGVGESIPTRNYFYLALIVLFFISMVSLGVYWYQLKPQLSLVNLSPEQITLANQQPRAHTQSEQQMQKVIDGQNAQVIKQFVTLKCEVVQQ